MAETAITSSMFERERWEARLSELIRAHGVPGAQLGVLAGDRIETVAAGVLRAETGQPVREQSVFQIGSITKLWTATIAMQLIDEGLLTLDTRVTDVLPELRLSDPSTLAGLTIWHLLTHTNGIDGDVFTDTGRGDDVLERYTALLADVAQTHPLGETWSYSNSGYVLLGRVIEKMTGTTWDQAIRDRIATPLGMTRTTTLPEQTLLHDAAVGHVVGMPEPVQAPVWSLPRSVGPAGLVTSTAAELLGFVRMHLAGGVTVDGTRLLSQDGTQAMAAHQVDLPDTHSLGDSWGLGWIRFDWNGDRLLGHDGTTIGQNAYLRVLPAKGIAVALLTNGGQTHDLFEALFREIFAELADVVMRPAFAPPEQPPVVPLGPSAGRYRGAAMQVDAFDTEDGPRIRIELLGDLAKLDPEPIQEHALTAVAEDLYAIHLSGAETWTPVTFYRIASGRTYVHFGARAFPAV